MKVYDRNLTGASAADAAQTHETQRSQSSSSARTSGPAGSGSGDRIELSSTLGSLSKALASFSSDRASKLASLSGQYHSGNYSPDSAAVSRGLVSEALGAS